MAESENRPTRPWDIFNKNIEKLEKEFVEQRLDICRGCEFFIKLTSQCGQCGCLMPLKAKLAPSVCPVGKWGPWDTSGVSFTELQ